MRADPDLARFLFMAARLPMTIPERRYVPAIAAIFWVGGRRLEQARLNGAIMRSVLADPRRCTATDVRRKLLARRVLQPAPGWKHYRLAADADWLWGDVSHATAVESYGRMTSGADSILTAMHTILPVHQLRADAWAAAGREIVERHGLQVLRDMVSAIERDADTRPRQIRDLTANVVGLAMRTRRRKEAARR